MYGGGVTARISITYKRYTFLTLYICENKLFVVILQRVMIRLLCI